MSELTYLALREAHDTRITDENRIWRVVYRVDTDAIVILKVIEICRRRLRQYEGRTYKE